MSAQAIILAAIESYDAATHSAVVRPLSHPTATLGPLLVAADVSGTALLAGTRVLVLLFADTGGVVLGRV